MEVLLKNLVQNTELFLSQENTDIVLETIDWGSVQSLTNSINISILSVQKYKARFYSPGVLQLLLGLFQITKQI